MEYIRNKKIYVCIWNYKFNTRYIMFFQYCEYIMKFNTIEKSSAISNWMVCIWNNFTNTNYSYDENNKIPFITSKSSNNY